MLVKTIPENLNLRSIEEAVRSFIDEIKLPANPDGVYQQTIDTIGHSLIFGARDTDIWLGIDNGSVKAYLIARIVKDIDNSFCYWISQAWLHPDHRNNGFLIKYWQTMKDHAKRLMCKNLIFVSTRMGESWDKLLAENFSVYATLLKTELN